MTDKERKSCIRTIELLRRLAFNVHGVMDVIDEQNCEKIIEMLNKPEPQWIPCSEGLPEEDGEYLVTFEKGYAEDYGFDLVGIAPYEVDCEGFGIWQENFDLHTLGSLGSEWADINVIAWMTLPEPYQPKEK